MEIGSIAEWATAIAETAAVLVALFLPYVDHRNSERKAARSFKLTLYAAVMRSRESGNMDALRTLVSISAFTDAGTRNKADLDNAQQILDIYDNSELADETKKKEIRQVAEQIKPEPRS